MKFSLIAIAFATAAMANPITRVRRQENGAFANVKVISPSGSTQIAGVAVGDGKHSFNSTSPLVAQKMLDVAS